MRARGRALLLAARPATPKSQPHPAPPRSSLLLPRQAARRTRRPPRLVKGGLKKPGRSPFMRGALLLMAEHFNDWDLQAVVRSCRVVAHPDPPPAAATAHPRGAQRAEPDRADAAPAEPPTTPAAARGEARAAAPPAPAVAQGHDRAPPAVASFKGGAALSLYDLEYLDLDHKPFLLPVTPRGPGDEGREREVMISFPAAAASTSGAQQRAVPPGRRAGARTPRPKRSKKSQLKKVVREMPVADGGASSSDPWAWRKYGQKPIKGSPYPRGYYKCSSMKGCMARKLVERSPAKPGVLIVTYMAEHCHPVPTQLNALAGTTRHKSAPGAAAADDNAATASSSPTKSHELGAASVGTTTAEDAARCGVDGGGGRPSTTAMGLEFCAEEITAVDDENELWPEGMDLDELLAPVDDDFDFEHVVDDEDAMLGRRLSL